MNALTSSGNLCLKWNNHSSAFLKSISNIQVKERFCDATIACQGKYFPVHRIILSTCSDYFDEIFERIQCQHPYIVFKDIDPNEMELLLNYMYQGEVNVIQEKLPSLIKAAEALKIKGLAVPDDIPSNKDTRKRASMGHSPLPKRRADERRKRNASELNSYSESIQSSTHSEDLANQSSKSSDADNEPTRIKEEPIDASEYVNTGIGNDFGESLSSLQGDEAAGQGEEKVFVNYPASDPSTYIKSEQPDHKDEEPYEEPSSSWRDLPGGNFVSTLLSSDISQQEDVLQMATSMDSQRVLLWMQRKNRQPFYRMVIFAPFLRWEDVLFTSIKFISSLLLLIGIYKHKIRLIRISVVLSLIDIGVEIVVSVVLSCIIGHPLPFIVVVFFLPLSFYFLVIVNSLANQMNMGLISPPKLGSV